KVMPRPGQNVRHIVPSHLFRNVLNGWLNAYYPPGDRERAKVWLLLQAWQKGLDNTAANLWPGPGVGNQAAGGLTVNLTKAAEKMGREGLAGPPAAAVVREVFAEAVKSKDPKVYALHPRVQWEWVSPLEELLAASSDGLEASGLVRDMAESAEFD